MECVDRGGYVAVCEAAIRGGLNAVSAGAAGF